MLLLHTDESKNLTQKKMFVLPDNQKKRDTLHYMQKKS